MLQNTQGRRTAINKDGIAIIDHFCRSLGDGLFGNGHILLIGFILDIFAMGQDIFHTAEEPLQTSLSFQCFQISADGNRGNMEMGSQFCYGCQLFLPEQLKDSFLPLLDKFFAVLHAVTSPGKLLPVTFVSLYPFLSDM